MTFISREVLTLDPSLDVAYENSLINTFASQDVKFRVEG